MALDLSIKRQQSHHQKEEEKNEEKENNKTRSRKETISRDQRPKTDTWEVLLKELKSIKEERDQSHFLQQIKSRYHTIKTFELV